VTPPIVLLTAVAAAPDVSAIVNAATTACRQALPARWFHHAVPIVPAIPDDVRMDTDARAIGDHAARTR
jgi:hypothetical protein